MSFCLDKLIKDFPEEDRKLLEQVFNDASDLKDASNNLKDFKEKMEARLDEIRLSQAKYKSQRALMVSTMKERLSLLDQKAYDGKPGDWLRDQFQGGRDTKVEGGNLGLKTKANVIVNRIERPFLEGLMAENIIEQRQDKELQKATMSLLEQMKPGGKPDLGGNPMATKFAKLVKTAQDSVLSEWERIGNKLGNIPGYIMRQSHDMAKIVADKAGWIKSMWENLDHEKTFGPDKLLGDTPEKINKAKLKFLEDHFEQHASGRWGTEQIPGVGDQFESGKIPGSGNKTPGSRGYHFKDGGWFNYNEKFGKGDLIDGVLNAINSDSLKIAQVETYGPKPYDAIQGDIQRMQKLYATPAMIEKYGAEKASAIVKKLASDREGILRDFRLAANMDQHPGVSTSAKVGEATRQTINVAMLALATLKKGSEWKVSADLISSLMGTNYFDTIQKLANDFVHTGMPSIPGIKGVSPTTRNLIGKFAINFIDDFTNVRNSERYEMGLGNPQTPGLMSRAENLMYNLGINQHTNASRLATVMTIGRFANEFAGKEFKDLNPIFQGNLGRWKIGPQEWDVIRQGVEEFRSGTSGITADAIKKIDSSQIQKVMDQYGIKGSSENFKLNALNKWLAFNLETSERTVLHTNSPTAAMMYGRFQNPNDTMSALVRVVLQYKSIALMFTHNQAMFLGSSAGESGPSFLGNMVRGLGNTSFSGGGIPTAIAGTAFGMGIYHLRTCIYNALHGKPMPDLHDPKTWEENLVGSGATGILGDIAHAAQGDKHGRGGIERTAKFLAGPGVSTAGDALVGTVTGNRDSLVSTAENITPFQSVPFVKPVLESMLFDHLHSDKFNQKNAERKLKQSGGR